MKALNVILVAVLVTFATMGIAQNVDKAGPLFSSKMIPITSVDLMSDFGKAISAQVDTQLFLTGNDHNGVYIATVRFNGKVCKVFGTYYQWVRFLRVNPRPLPSEKDIKSERKDY